MMRRAFLLLLMLSLPAVAAKVPVDVMTPTTQVDTKTGAESPLTKLDAIVIEWGTCTATTFTRQAGMSYAETRAGVKVRVYAYPSGLARVCIRAYAVANGVSSDPSNIVAETLQAPLSKPVPLGQPILLPPAKSESPPPAQFEPQTSR